MPLHIKRSGAWATVPAGALKIKSGGTWQTVKAAWVKSGGTWRQFYASNPYTIVAPATFNGVYAYGATSARVSFQAGGGWAKYEDGPATQTGSWATGAGMNAAWIRRTKTGGNIGFTDTGWEQMSSEKSFTVFASTGQDNWLQLFVEFAYQNGGPVIASGTVTMFTPDMGFNP